MKWKDNIRRAAIATLKVASLLILAAAIVVGIFWANYRAADRLCSKVRITVDGENTSTFVTPQTVMSEISARHLDAKGKKINLYNTDTLTHVLAALDYLENAQCTWLNNGTLDIHVTQIVPIMRVYDNAGNSFYLNADGKRVGASANRHVDVPVFTGIIRNPDSYSDNAASFIPLAKYINARKHLREYVTAVNAADTNNVIIVPNIRGHVVNFGNVSDGKFDNKFAKVKKMYQKVIPATGWWKYDTISVKWKHQIVATKRSKAEPPPIDFDDDDDETPPDIGSITVD